MYQGSVHRYALNYIDENKHKYWVDALLINKISIKRGAALLVDRRIELIRSIINKGYLFQLADPIFAVRKGNLYVLKGGHHRAAIMHVIGYDSLPGVKIYSKPIWEFRKWLVKIKKLLSLAESDNIHERELATLKANQLLLKHNINRYQLNKMNNNDLNEDEDEEICLKKVFEAKKTTAKMQAIYEILGCFLVQPVFNHGKGLVYLEVIGSRINVEFADYITQFLDFELENIWQFHKKEHSLKGIKAKNSFFKGVGKGYVDKIQIQHKEVTTGNELVILKQELEQQVSKVYGRLSFSKTSAGTCHDSLSLGKSAGQALNIRKGLTSSKSSNRLLSYFKSENKS